jgi:hypothetical protein
MRLGFDTKKVAVREARPERADSPYVYIELPEPNEDHVEEEFMLRAFRENPTLALIARTKVA